MSTDTQLIPLDEISADKAPAIYGVNILNRYVEVARAGVAGEVPDLTTRKGRERIASLAAQVARSKTAVEKPGRAYLKRIKELPKAIEAELREFVQQMDALRDEVRAPLNEWEQAEDERKARHQGGIDQINLRLECRDLDAGELKTNIEWLEGLAINEGWEEFEAEAARAKDKALIALREALAAREKYDAEQAELARLRAEAEERARKDEQDRIAREAAERATREAEQRAQAERDAAAKREADALAAAEQSRLSAELAEQRRIAAERQAKIDRQAAIERERIAAEQAEQRRLQAAEDARNAEIKRQADEKARIEAEAKARAADKAHKAKIMGQAKEALIAMNITEELAKAIVLKIARREIPHVTISF